MMEPATSSGSLSASTQIYTGRGRLCSLDLAIPSAGGATVTLYDGTSTSGLLLGVATLTSSATQSISLNFNIPRAFNTGLYASISGTSSFVATYQPG